MIEIVGRSAADVARKLPAVPESASSLSDFDRVVRGARTIEGVLNSETSLLLGAVYALLAPPRFPRQEGCAMTSATGFSTFAGARNVFAILRSSSCSER